MKYEIEIRRYTAHNDDDTAHECESILTVHAVLQRECGHGPFRAWVNGKEIKNAYHGITLDELMVALDPAMAAVATSFGNMLRMFPTNPATYAAIGSEL